jgi:nitroimidazol reductase NimA-like FMN-containing flavoprotein (pyridoxamine 5'-phosphate oxidase superfamily)
VNREHDQPSLSRARRRDRAVEDEAWIRAFLHRGPYGVLATVDGQQPFLNPMNFVLDETRHALYIHTSPDGRVNENLGANDRVCFCVSWMGRLLPGKQAGEFGVEYASVVVFGRARPVTNAAEAGRALQMLLDKYFADFRSGWDYRPLTPDERGATRVYRIDIDTWSAKKREEPPGFPGAFAYAPRSPGR